MGTAVFMALPPVSAQAVKYSLVGVAGLVLHWAVLTGLVELAGVHYQVAFAVALPFTFTSKFILDKFWTFRR